jgi:hypothetical protein
MSTITHKGIEYDVVSFRPELWMTAEEYDSNKDIELPKEVEDQFTQYRDQAQLGRSDFYKCMLVKVVDQQYILKNKDDELIISKIKE